MNIVHFCTLFERIPIYSRSKWKTKMLGKHKTSLTSVDTYFILKIKFYSFSDLKMRLMRPGKKIVPAYNTA